MLRGDTTCQSSSSSSSFSLISSWQTQLCVQ